MDKFSRHYEESAFLRVSPERLFAFVDDHARFSSHMTRSSWRMGGGKMEVRIDDGRGQSVGSHIRLSGKVFGIPLFLDEVVILRDPPYRKTWETVGVPRLLIVGSYQMGLEINAENGGSRLKVFLDYELPPKGRWLGRIFGGTYARWCVRQMLKEANKA